MGQGDITWAVEATGRFSFEWELRVVRVGIQDIPWPGHGGKQALISAGFSLGKHPAFDPFQQTYGRGLLPFSMRRSYLGRYT